MEFHGVTSLACRETTHVAVRYQENGRECVRSVCGYIRGFIGPLKYDERGAPQDVTCGMCRFKLRQSA